MSHASVPPIAVKHPAWVEALHHFFDRAQTYAFSYGTHDCCLFVAEAIEVMTGHDLMAHYRGRYNSVASIEQIVAEEKATCLTVLIRRELHAHGWEVKLRAFATRGDVALLENGALVVLAMDGRHVIGMDIEHGTRCVPLAQAVKICEINTPERNEPLFFAAAAQLESLAYNTPLRCKVKDVDRYQRRVVQCWLPNGRDLAAAMVASGLAKDMPRYSKGYYKNIPVKPVSMR
jgi:hypothetical protein